MVWCCIWHRVSGEFYLKNVKNVATYSLERRIVEANNYFYALIALHEK